ncbi:hypothetical protein [Salipaludibacillus sp. CF4.18]
MNKLQKSDVQSIEMDIVSFRHNGMSDVHKKKKLLEKLEDFK